MNILIYYQNHYHTVFLESLMESFIQKGHTVYLLTTCQKGLLHKKSEEIGVKTFSYIAKGKRLIYILQNIRYLIKFCKKNKIDVVYSHLQLTNLIAVLSQSFVKAKVFPCRHHSNDVFLRKNKNAIRIDKLVNKKSKKLIVVSNAVKEHIVKFENTNASKIEVISLGYNFSLYDKPDETIVKTIKTELNCHLLLILIGRLTPNKNHITGLKVFNKLIQNGYDVKLLILDDGPEKSRLNDFIEKNNLTSKIKFTGFVDNTMNYLAACDILIHPSISEASNQVVKEAALLKIPSIVCDHVGDFSEYIIHESNGFLIAKQHIENEMYEIITKYYNKKAELKIIGENAQKTVLNKFDIEKISNKYLALVSN